MLCCFFISPTLKKKKEQSFQSTSSQSYPTFSSVCFEYMDTSTTATLTKSFLLEQVLSFFFFVEIHFFVFCVLFFSYPLPAPVNGKKKPTTQKKPPLSLIKRLPDSFYFFFFIVFFTEAHLNSCFKHFIYFVLEFSLVDPKVFFLFLFLIK